MDNLETHFDLSMSRTFIVRPGTFVPADQGHTEAAAHFKKGAIVDTKYVILSVIGEGGMGSVYAAHHRLLDKNVALKTFRSRQIDAEAWHRFAREAQAIGKLSHKNIVQVFDFGVSDDVRPFYTMELLTGVSLADRIDKNPLSMRQTLRIFVDVANGLAHAHKFGIIHRDIKPGNIHLCEAPGRPGQITDVKVVDFGIAKLAYGDSESKDTANQQMLTSVGLVFGSPLYMSPEQSLGMPTDHTTDIYSFGCALFESLTGEPPFMGSTSFATIVSHQTVRPPKLAEKKADGQFPRRLESLVACLLEKDKSDRFQSFDEVRIELEHILAILSAEREAQGSESQALGLRSIAPQGGSAADITKRPRSAQTAAQEDSSAKVPLSVLASLASILLLVSGAVLYFYQTPLKKLLVAAPRISALPAQSSKTLTPVAHKVSTDTTNSSPSPSPSSSSNLAPSANLASPKRYLTGEVLGGKVFEFPEGEPIGYLEIANRAAIPASGRQVVPRDKACGLLVEEPIARNPDLLKGFGPHDLRGIRFDENTTCTDAHFKIIQNFVDIESLDVQNCKLTIESMDYINKLHKLRFLTLFRSGIIIREWCDLEALPRIQELIVSDFGRVTRLLKQLKEANSLRRLDLQWCEVGDEDLPLIGTFDKLSDLQINFSSMTNTGLAGLVRAPHIKYMKIGSNKLDGDSAVMFARMPALKRLIIGTRRWSPADRVRLASVMGRSHIDLEMTEY